MNTTKTSHRTDEGIRGVEGERKGRGAKAIEKRTSKLPSDLYLWAAGLAILGSLILETLSAFGHLVRFIRVKVAGSERRA